MSAVSDRFAGEFATRLSRVDRTDLFGDRTAQLEQLRSEALDELLVRLKSGAPATAAQRAHEEAFFLKLNAKLPKLRKDPVGTLQVADVRRDVTDLRSLVQDRRAQLTRFFQRHCYKSTLDITTAYVQELSSSRDLVDRVNDISKEALDVLSRSSSYSTDRAAVANIFRDVQALEKEIATEVTVYNDAYHVMARCKELQRAAAAGAAPAASAPPPPVAATPSKFWKDQSWQERARGVVGTVVDKGVGAIHLARHPSEIGRAMKDNPGTTLGLAVAGVAGAYVVGPAILACETVRNIATIGAYAATLGAGYYFWKRR